MKQSETHNRLSKELAGLSIPTDFPGFYDHPAFVAMERKDPDFLETYAAFVRSRPIESHYAAQARRTVEIVGPALNEELVLDGRMGACIDLSMVLSRILEREGVWNYVVKGALTIDYPKSTGYGTGYFWPIDVTDIKAGHVWVCAPPYSVIDLTVHQQPYGGDRRRHIPKFVITESTEPYTPSIFDICSPEFLSILRRRGLPITNKTLFEIQPQLPGFFQSFPATIVRSSETILKYIPVAITASDRPLEEITSLRLRGRTGYEVYEQRLKAALPGPA